MQKRDQEPVSAEPSENTDSVKLPRQQQRAAERAAKKAASKKVSEPKPTSPLKANFGDPKKLHVDDLDDRQIRGMRLAEAISKKKIPIAVIDPERTIYWSARTQQNASEVTRHLRNLRGTLQGERRCSCSDFKKNGRIDCYHIFADRVLHREVIIEGKLARQRSFQATAERRPTRMQQTADGRSHRTAQRAARVKMPTRIPELVLALKQADDLENPNPSIQERRDRVRAQALVFKIVHGLSFDAMDEVYKRLIEAGYLRLKRPPCQNSLSRWMNNPRLMPILRRYLGITTKPFRRCETSGIIDSTAISQMQTASYRMVRYGGDERDGADWMKCHTIVGAETSIVMDVLFSAKDVHDIRYLKPLVESAQNTFTLEHVLADKAYLSGDVVGWLWERGIKAVIPVKKRWNPETKEHNLEACQELVDWYDNRQRSFHEAFRFRVKIESVFSHLKRLSDGYCWSRGRRRTTKNADEPCDAWVNELLCKFIYINLRSTVTREEMTGYQANYLAPDKFFPMPIEPLIAA
jgi:hypothetical protein